MLRCTYQGDKVFLYSGEGDAKKMYHGDRYGASTYIVGMVVLRRCTKGIRCFYLVGMVGGYCAKM